MFVLICPDAGCVVCRATRGPRAPRGPTSCYTASPLRDFIGKYFSTYFIVAPFRHYVDQYNTSYYSLHWTAKLLSLKTFWGGEKDTWPHKPHKILSLHPILLLPFMPNYQKPRPKPILLHTTKTIVVKIAVLLQQYKIYD